MKFSLLYKLLGKQISMWQMLGFLLANLCGMTIVLMAVQFYTDVIPLFTKGDSFMKPGQMVVTKHVSTARTLTRKPPVFREREVEELRRQDFVDDIGEFTPSRYAVFATIGSQSVGMEFSTEMFFESIPDKFIDVDLSEWAYHEGDDNVPIILPRNYLNLYNFGFAASRGLPTISEGLIRAVAIRLHLQGSHGSRQLTGHVVAFSKRLNTILVPQQFMDEMNNTLSPLSESRSGDESSVRPSRLAIQVDNMADDRIADYLQGHGYETEADDADAARTVSFVRIISIVVMVIGLIISILSFYLLLLSIFLLLQKHTEKIDNLLMIGYSPFATARPFFALAFGLNGVVLVVSIALAASSRRYYLPMFGDLYPAYEIASFSPTVVVGVLLFVGVAVLNYIAIRRKVLTIWAMHH